MPAVSTSRCNETSAFSRATTSSGMRAIGLTQNLVKGVDEDLTLEEITL